ncbi:WD repeat and coiled-coil-containing protein-like isoform X2 [Ornithodoros turicata]|uniref:WD repeat and coiled-coil-containing protein-like isoform X2 n=1 Tax=Ornithodoros turicata TaxID=34597 RepID=UPI003138A4F1
MELSRCRIRRTGCNALKSCFYCTVGLIWADGDCVFITPLQPPKNSTTSHHQVHFCRHQVLGLFRTVHGLCYSSPKKWPPFISVIAERVDDGSLELSIWRMNTAVQCVSFSKWCVLSLPQLPVLQGCLWHPEKDVFCLVFKDSARIYVINEDNSELQEVKAITPFAGSRFVCGTWSKNGKRLILATESTLMFYNIPCSDIEQTEMEVILGLERVCCIESLEGDRFVCTVELPLDSMVVRSRSERYLLDQTRGPLETLLNIHAATEGPLEGSSQLFLLQWNPDTDKPEVRSWDELYGILSPDLLAVEPSSSLIVVGSNSCHTLYVYGIVDEQLEKLHDINLPKEERPKGVTIHNQEALLMLAKLPEEERQVLSLPRSEFVEYEVVLQSIPLSGSAQPQGSCTLQTLLGQAAKSSISLDSAVSDPINRYGRSSGVAAPTTAAASTASSSHMLNMAELGRNSGEAAATMTWPRGLLGDLKSHLQSASQRPPSHASATSESHLASRHQEPPPLVEDLTSLLHFHEAGRSDHRGDSVPANDLLDLSSLLSGGALSSSELLVGRNFEELDGEAVLGRGGFHEEFFKKSREDNASRHKDVTGMPHAPVAGGAHTLPRAAEHRTGSEGPALPTLGSVASRLAGLEGCVATLGRSQSRELQEIKNELSAIRRLLISVLFHVLPEEARSDAVAKYT